MTYYIKHPTKLNVEICRHEERDALAKAHGYDMTIHGHIVTKPRKPARTGYAFCSGFGFDGSYRYYVDYNYGKLTVTNQIYSGLESEIESNAWTSMSLLTTG